KKIILFIKVLVLCYAFRNHESAFFLSAGEKAFPASKSSGRRRQNCCPRRRKRLRKIHLVEPYLRHSGLAGRRNFIFRKKTSGLERKYCSRRTRHETGVATIRSDALCQLVRKRGQVYFQYQHSPEKK